MNWKRFIPYAAIAAVHLGLVVLIVKSWPILLSGANPLPPETRRYFEISRKIEGEVARLRDYIVADTILPLVETERLTVRMPEPVVSKAEYTRRTLDRALPRESKTAINVIALPGTYGAFGFPEFGHGPRYYAGVKDGMAYCAIVLPYWSYGDTHDVRVDGADVLGPCAFWARHGPPGAGIHEWLLQGGAEFARGQTGIRFSSNMEDWMFEEPRPNHAYGFGLRGQKCHAGKLDACRSGVVSPDSGAPAPTGAMRGGDPWNPRLFPGQGTMLSDIEREFGSERFVRFWASREEVEPAFEAAFGVPLAEWVADWARERFGPREYGSRMTPLTILLSVITVGVFAGLAALAVNRRRV